ncbi:sigma-70 family RNA polymerase sigma factor [Mycobacterium sp. BMJ-28]
MANTPSLSADDDATLAVAAAAGDRVAFAAIYDRYANRLHDFCIGMLRDRDAAADCVQDVFVIAATRLVQLREPDRLRSWLYAIARSEALARIRARRRELPSEELPEIATGEPDMDTLAARSELADLISAASGGLSERDRLVLELAYRQGLDGPELAEALGVTARNANTLVERLRETIARSLGALLVCRRVSADPERCPELAAILGDWHGELTVLLRKRAARHIESCSICDEERARMITPAALLGAAPVVIPAPAWLRDKTLRQAVPGGSAVGVAGDSWWPEDDVDVSDLGGRHRVRWAALGAGIVVVAILAVYRAVSPPDVVPMRSPGVVTSTTTTTAGPPAQFVPPPPTSSESPAIPPPTTPSAIPRTAPSTTEAPSPVPEQAPPSGPTTTITRGGSSFHPTPRPESPVQQEPSTEESPITEEPQPSSKAPPTTSKPPKSTPRPPTMQPPPKKSPDNDCPPDNPQCQPPVFS